MSSSLATFKAIRLALRRQLYFSPLGTFAHSSPNHNFKYKNININT